MRTRLKGLQVAEPFFAPDCVVLVDDTNFTRHVTPFRLHRAEPKFLPCAARPRTRSNAHPTLWNGVVVLQRTNPEPA